MIDPQPGDRVRVVYQGRAAGRFYVETVRPDGTYFGHQHVQDGTATLEPVPATAGNAAAGRDAAPGAAYELAELIIDAWASKGLVQLADCGDGCDEFADDTEVVFKAALAAAGVIATSPAASTPDTELRERYARAIGWKDTTLPALRDDRLDYYRALADAVMAERDTEVERLRAEAIRHGERATEEFGLTTALAEEQEATRELARQHNILFDSGQRLSDEVERLTTELYDRPTRHAYEAKCEALERRRVALVKALPVPEDMTFYAAVDAVGALANELADLRAQQQDMVRLPADWRDQLGGVIEPGDFSDVSDVIRLLDSWRGSPASTDDQAAGEAPPGGAA